MAIIISLHLALFVQAQSVISCAGNEGSTTHTVVSWTIGEPVTECFPGETICLTQGMIQGSIIVTTIHDVLKTCKLKVYPNPVVMQLNIEMETVDAVFLQLRLYTSKGELLFQEILNEKYTSVPMENYPVGSYLMCITSTENQAKSTYKILKK